MICFFEYKNTPVGTLCIVADELGIKKISFHAETTKALCEETPLIKQAYAQLCEYFTGRRTSFDLPLAPKGTEFQCKVWQALCDIPYGETRSYKQIATIAGSPKGCRAVGMANNRNPIAIVVPCHRVIGANGKMVGYAGGLSVKEKLLLLEKENSL